MAQKLFKVVRHDLTSFHDPDFRYRIGGTHRATGSNKGLCADGVLHASLDPAGAALYGEWPYRLIEVEGTPIVSDGDKVGCRQLKVVGEADVAQCFGPSGAKVFALLRIVGEAQFETIRGLQWTATADKARAVSAAVQDAIDTAYHAIWSTDLNDAENAAWHAAGMRNGPVRGAVWAALIFHLIGLHGYTQKQHDLLVGPFVSVFGDEWVNA